MKRKEIKNTNRRNEEICKTGKREENERNVHTQTEEKAPNVLICKPSHHVAISLSFSSPIDCFTLIVRR